MILSSTKLLTVAKLKLWSVLFLGIWNWGGIDKLGGNRQMGGNRQIFAEGVNMRKAQIYIEKH